MNDESSSLKRSLGQETSAEDLSPVMETKLSGIVEDILARTSETLRISGLRNPMIGRGEEDHRWLYPDNGWFWTDGFWCGQLWLAYMVTGDEKFRNAAQMRNPHLQQILETPLWSDHDLGFEFSLSHVADHKLTGSEHARVGALRAADQLRGRFDLAGRYLRAWNPEATDLERARKVQGKIIIDSMQNIPLLLWAHRETGVPSYKDAALATAQNTLSYLVRDDWSSYHTYDFDPVTYQPLQGRTAQGYADESCWSRGQAWAIHGFAQLAEITGDLSHAETSSKLADYALAHLTSDGVPVWDYLLPDDEPPLKDTSAGSVTASGLLLLADVLTRSAQADRALRYRNAGLHMLLALRQDYDLTGVAGAQGLLSHAASDVPASRRMGKAYLANAMLPYGDYYYFEAVLRALGHRSFFWF